MKIFNLEKVRYPIIYVSIGFIISSIFYAYYDFNFGLVLFITSLFFIVILFREGIEFTTIMLIVFFIGIGINNNFYNGNIKVNNLRIVKNYGNYAIGEIKGREVELYGDFKNVLIGSKVSIDGEFDRNINKELGRVGTIKVSKYTVIENSIFTQLSKFKYEFKDKLRENIGDRDGGIIASILFGKDEFLDEYDEKEMRNLGIIHAISVSGLHIGLIFLLSKKISNTQIGLGITFLYVILSGLSFSSLRAFIGIFFIYIGFLFRKTSHPLAGIAVSMIILFFWKPYFIFNIGFQLSYGATIGIILFNKKIESKLYKVNSMLRSVISLSVSAQIIIFPLLIVYFNTFSTAFIMGNLILVPIINLLLIVGLVAMVTYKINFIFGFISFLLIEIMNIFDKFMKMIKYMDLDQLYLEEEVAYFYIFILFSFYLYKRGIKFMKYAPIPYMIFLFTVNYSIYPKIEYRREGAILISYKGEKSIMTMNKNLDIKELKRKTGGKLYKEEKFLIDEKSYINISGKDYILNIGEEKYLLKMSKGKKTVEYDIIDFKEGREKKLKLKDNKVLVVE